MTLLRVRQLDVAFATPQGTVHAVNGLSYEVGEGEALALVGESGSGKSQSALALLGLLAGNARVTGSVQFENRELLGLAERELRAIRGARIGMVFQDPMTGLTPHLRIGTQLAEVLVAHQGLDWDAARAEAARMLDAVQVADAPRRLRQYPHELSGGLRQRVMIAGALLCRPRLLIADEPTTALDVTVQSELITLLAGLRREFGVALLLITHDLGLVGELCERTLVMYAGQVMESGPTERLLARPTHPYTAALLHSRPGLDMVPGTTLPVIKGQPPDLRALPAGCPFQMRCAHALAACVLQRPPLEMVAGGVERACLVSPRALHAE